MNGIMKRLVVYELIEDDVQNVSEQIIGRKLKKTEMLKIKDLIAEKISWFEAIESSINEIIENEEFDNTCVHSERYRYKLPS